MNQTFAIGGEREVHRIGFGAMRVTGRGIWGPPPDVGAALALLRHVVACGVDFIDTADSYGPNVSEELIARALAPYPPALVIATKAGNLRPGPGEWVAEGRPERLRAACEGSLRRLGLERIELYQLHRVDPNVPLEESVGALAELRSEGKIAHIGLSNVTVEQLELARRVVAIATVQNRFSLRDREAEPLLELCEREWIGFIPYFPLGAGDLARAEGPLAEVAAELGATTGQVALAWLLRRSPVLVPIPGTSSRAHFDENLAARDLALSDAQFARLSA